MLAQGYTREDSLYALPSLHLHLQDRISLEQLTDELVERKVRSSMYNRLFRSSAISRQAAHRYLHRTRS